MIKKIQSITKLSQKLRCVILILIILTFSMCTKESETTHIKIDPEKAYDSDLPKLKITSIVPLETTTSSLLGKIEKMESIDDKFYILDPRTGRSLMAFSKEGKFINKTDLGEGPGQIQRPQSFTINRVDQKILVYDFISYINEYDLDLNFISRTHFKGVPVVDFSITNQRDTIVYSHYEGDYVYTLYSGESNKKVKKYIEDFKYSGVQGINRSISNTHEILFIAPYNYYVYRLKQDKITKGFYFDFGKYKLTEEDVKKGGVSGCWKLVRSGERVSSLSNISETENFVSFSVKDYKERLFYSYSRKTNNLYKINNYFTSNQIPKCNIMSVSSEGDFFHALVDPDDLLEFQNKTGKKLIQEEINADQNPYLLTFELTEK